MVTRLALCLLTVLCLHSAAGAQIQGCDGLGKLVEGYSDPSLNCHVTSTTTTVRWTAITKSGKTLILGTCYGINNCTGGRDTSVYYFRHSYMRLRNVDHKAITCQETLTNGTVLSDTCQLNYARVSFLSTTQYDFLENSTRDFYCYNSPYTNSTVTLALTTVSGQTLHLGTCRSVGSCTSPHSPDFTVSRTSQVRTRISIRNIARDNGGQLFCSFTYKGFVETDNITLNVYNPATVSNCHAELLRSNWSAILSCDVSHVFSSAGDYSFTVYETFQVLKHSVISSANSYVFDGRRSYRDMLTPYTNNTNNKLYYRGRLVYSWPISPLQGLYTQLRIRVYYGYSYSAYVNVDFAANITRPSQPAHNCSNIIYIPETGMVPCVCTADFLGSPPGRLLWLLGDTAIAIADYNVSQLEFPNGQVSRQHSGMMVRCHVDWIEPISTASTRHVIYSEPSSSKTYQAEAIAIGVALGIVVLVFVIVMIVLYRRGRLCQRREREGARPKTQDNEDSNYYTSLNLSQVTTNQSNGGRQGVSCPSTVYQGEDNAVYENTESHGGHM